MTTAAAFRVNVARAREQGGNRGPTRAPLMVPTGSRTRSGCGSGLTECLPVPEAFGKRSELEERLAHLLEQVTPENRHGEIDWGGPVGKEVW